MKKLMISIFAIAAMVSCTSENEIIDNGGKNDEKVEIKLNGGISAITKAGSGAVSNDLIDDLNVYFVRQDDVNNTPTPTTWTSTLYAKIGKESNHPITFYTDAGRTTENPQYYHNEQYTHLVGYYLDDLTPSTLSDNGITFTIDGTQDIMSSTVKTGSKTEKFSEIEFQHKLSQINFQIGANPDDLVDIQGLYGKITKIEVINQPKTLKLTFNSTPSLEVATTDTGDGSFELNIPNNEQDLTSTLTPITGTLMIYADTEAGKTATPITLKITTVEFPAGIEVPVILNSGNSGLETGKTHTIELTFNKASISPTAKIAAWGSGSTGSGTVK